MDDLLDIGQTHELAQKSLVKIKKLIMDFIGCYLESLSSLNHVLDRMLVPVASIVALAFQLLRQLLELVPDFLPLKDILLGLFKFSADCSDFGDELVSHALNVVLQLLLAFLNIYDLLPEVTNVGSHVFQQESLVDQLLLQCDLTHLLVVDLCVQVCLLSLELALTVHIFLKHWLVRRVDLLLQLVQERV